jgi:hypothetical protein
MNNWKQRAFSPYALIGLVAIIALGFGFIGCDDGDGEKVYPKKITREFKITGFAKDITVKDTRTGFNDKNLKELGIITRLENGLKGQTNTRVIDVLGRGIEIHVENTTSYNYYKSYSETKVGLNFSRLSDPEEDVPDLIETAFSDMYEPPFPKYVKVIVPLWYNKFI